MISVIVPVFRAESWLDRCVLSILAQDQADLELLLIDDGSPDRCGEMCDRWAEKDPRIHVFHKTNGGQSSARNCGLDRAAGQYIAFVDADDWVEPFYLSYLFSLFPENDEGCMFTACNHTILRNGKEKAACALDEPTKTLSRESAFEDVLFHGCMDVAPWGKLYKREVFDGLRYPEGRLFEDTWLFGDILNTTEYVVFGSKSCYFYEMHDFSTVNQGFREKNLEYIEAAEKLAGDALACDPGLQVAAVRRINHARFSVLRYMENCDARFLATRSELRRQILADASKYTGDSRTPKRDKVAVMLLKPGLRPFYLGWRIYSKLRP